MLRAVLATAVLASAIGFVRPAAAAPVYLALGDSITFGETDLQYIPSFGDRGYVGKYADILAARNGIRPQVINLAIDGETTGSFMTGTGRTTPVVGRTDPILAAQNLNYSASPFTPQITLLRSTVAAQQMAGNTIETVSITQGFNNVAALASNPSTALQLLPSTLSTFRAEYSSILAEIRQLLPNASLFLLGYYNPFPGDPGNNPATPIFAAGGAALNAIIRDLAGQYGAAYVDNFTPFVGNEAAYTFIDEMPAGSSIPDPFGGVLPVGNVHPNDTGYSAIAGQVASAQVVPVPEPSSLALLGLAIGAAVVPIRRRRARTAV